jgi:lysozyme family protein
VTEDDIIAGVLAREGGYSNRAADSGGPTNFGITLAALQNWRGDSALTAHDVRALTRAEAQAIYRQEYIIKPGFDRIPDPHLRAHVVDFGVTSGPATAARMLQRVVGASPDGVLGPQTLAAIAALGATRVSNRLMLERIRLSGKIAQRRPKDIVHLGGWLNRCIGFFVET